MKYFSYNEYNVVEVVNNPDKRVVVRKEMSPLALSADEIRQRTKDLKENKSKFKKLILNFDELTQVEKLNLLCEFYVPSFVGLKYYLIENYKKQFPVERLVPSKLTFKSKDNGEILKCDVKVLAKKGVKFVPLKTYSQEELEQLIQEEKIVVIGYDATKTTKTMGEDVEKFVGKYCPEFDEVSVAKIVEYPVVAAEILKDVTLEELKVDYELLYLPAYKSGIKFLAGCAKASNELEAQKRKKLHKEAQESNEKSKVFAEIEKELADTAKGR